MANSANFFTSGLRKCLDGTIAFLTDTIKAYLVASTYTPNVDDDFVSGVTEIGSVSGYTPGFGGAGRKTLASKTITDDDTNNRIIFTAASISYGALGTGATIGGQALCKEVTSDAASPVISFNGLAADVPTNGASVTWNWHATGIGVINT